jgi:hypothetical protein
MCQKDVGKIKEIFDLLGKRKKVKEVESENNFSSIFGRPSKRFMSKV